MAERDIGPPEIKNSEIILGKELGRGAFGLVYEGTCRAIPVAVKVPKLLSMSPERIALFKKEIETMSRIFHPNVCLFLGACTEDPKSIKIVTEKLEGDLQTLVKKNDPPLSTYDRLKLAKETAQGVAWLHGMGCLHRDLKTPNILYDKNKVAKVCDFGLSHFIETEVDFFDEENKPRGTPLYMSPEVLSHKPVTRKVDVYAFAIVVWELLTGKAPFAHHNKMRTFSHAICNLGERPPLSDLPSNVPESCKNLMNRCWDHNPNVRPEFEEIVTALDDIMIESAISDAGGCAFWKKHFKNKESAPFNQFATDVYAYMGLQLPSSSSQEEEALKLKCLEEVFAEKGWVSLLNFGVLLGWYGPLSQDGSFLERTLNFVRAELGLGILDQYYFHGNLPQNKAENLLQGQPSGTFLVRFSRTPGCFAISRSSATPDGKLVVDNLRIEFQGGKYSLRSPTTVYEDENLAIVIRKAAKEFGLTRTLATPYQHLFVKESIRGGYGNQPTTLTDNFSFGSK
eukprot:TRINITY_DN1729_c0_g1_i2.p1 TRINITY_DN1729_c0_g1~~TRINITY_DN1729_c0_g1_i2.p1  ORF type:complete len:525 (-),score=176.76 TRINITY_DN1729_c0_g1_i2:35-1567(-)